jgi:glycosyltransferase involved in cell wall biosynthesis
MKQRIFVLTGDSPEIPGGMEHAVRELIRGLEQRGYAVEVFHRNNTSAPAWVARPTNKWQGYAADVLISWYLGLRVRERMGEDVVAVVSNGPFGWYVPCSLNIRKIHFYHGTYRGQANEIRPFISGAGVFKLKWWDSMVLERMSGRGKQILCNSDQTREQVSQYFGYEGSTVWYPLDTMLFRPLDKLATRRGLGLPDRGHIGLFVGNTQPTKNFGLVRRLIEELGDMKWILALRGQVPKDLVRDDRICLFPNASPAMLPQLYSAADFAVCPSFYEAFGYVVAEALCCGTPMIASPGGASLCFLSEPPLGGFLVRRPDATADYMVAIRKVLQDSESFRQLVINHVRPKVEKVMGSENWWHRFFELTGL